MRAMGAVRANSRTCRYCESRRNSEICSDVSTEESSVWVYPLNEERGFIAYIFS